MPYDQYMLTSYKYGNAYLVGPNYVSASTEWNEMECNTGQM